MTPHQAIFSIRDTLISGKESEAIEVLERYAEDFVDWIKQEGYEPTLDKRGWVKPAHSISKETSIIYQLYLKK